MNSYTLESVITYSNYFNALMECNKDVNYKYSVQSYDNACMFSICETINTILDGKIPEIRDVHNVVIRERGKERIITPIEIGDRITQKVLCDNLLVPLIMPHLIFDNGASLKGKGTNFARKRVNKFIEQAKRMWGADNLYALTFDFKGYFDNIPHEQCYRVLDKYIEDKRLVDLIIGIIESYKLKDIQAIEDAEERAERLRILRAHKDIGICLGSQISQIMAVAVPNDFDHYIKDVRGFKFYERYMDDGVIIFNDKDTLIRLKDELSDLAEKYGLHFNKKKTRVVKLTKGFTFLKIQYKVFKDSDETLKKLVRQGIVRERRKLKKFEEKVRNGEMSLDDVYANMQSWNAHSKFAKCDTTTKAMFELYDKLYGGYRMTRKYYNDNPDVKRRRKVTKH